jgi:O-antigen/teichoic acid export membrane protein
LKKISRKKSTIWNLVFLYTNLGIGIVNGILIVPLFLGYIDHKLYGAWLATGNILVWLTLIDPGIGDVLIQRVSVAYGNQNKKELSLILSSSVLLSIVISLLALVSSYILSNYLPFIINFHGDKSNELILAFRIAAIGTALTLFSFAFSGSALGFQRTKEIGIARNVAGIIGVLATLLLLLKGQGLFAIAYGILLKSIISLISYAIILGFCVYKEKIVMAFSITYMKSFSRIFTYTFLSKLFSTLANNIDLILVARFIDVNTVTMLELTRRPLRLLQNFMNMPSIALLPAMSNLSGEGNIDKLRNQTNRYLRIFNWVLVLTIAGFITFNGQLVTLWVGKQFYIGNLLNALLCVSFIFVNISYNLSNITYALGDIKGNSIITVYNSVLYLLLIVLLGKYWGIYGIILTPVIANLLTYFWYFPKKLVTLNIFNRTIGKSLLTDLLVASLIAVFPVLFFIGKQFTNWLSLVLYVISFALLFAVLMIVSKNYRGEWENIINHILRKSSK